MELITHAFVIAKEDLGEADAALALYTKDRGKISATVRGYRKLTSKLRPALPLFSKSYVLLHAGSSQHFLVTGAEAIERHLELRRNPQALRLALISNSLLEALAPPAERDGELWSALDAYFSGLSLHRTLNDKKGLSVTTLIFLAKTAWLLGIRPELSRCSECGSVKNLGWFSEERGGLLCSACSQIIGSVALPVPHALLPVLRAIQELSGPPAIPTRSGRLWRAGPGGASAQTQPLKEFQLQDIDQALTIMVRFLRWRR